MSTGCRDKREAEQWRIQRLAEMGRGNYVGLKAQALRMDDVFAMLRDNWAARGKDSALRVHKARIERFARHFGGLKAVDLTQDRLTRFIAERRSQGAAVATINLDLGVLRTAMRIAVAAKRLSADHLPQFRMLSGEHVRRDFLDDASLELILSRMQPHTRAAARGQFVTGWRISEILGLDWAHVLWEAREIRIDTNKTDEPDVMPFDGWAPLERLLEGQLEIHEALKGRGIVSPWVFPSPAGKKIRENAVQRDWRRARKLSGVICVEGPYLHGARRKMAKDLVDAGTNLLDAAGITRHKSLSMFKRYAIRTKDSKRRALEKLSEYKAQQPEGRRVVGIKP